MTTSLELEHVREYVARFQPSCLYCTRKPNMARRFGHDIVFTCEAHAKTPIERRAVLHENARATWAIVLDP